MARFAVVGLGRIGLRVLWLLSKLGHEVFGIGINGREVERARSLGLEAHVVDVFAGARFLRRRWEPDAVLTALPGEIGFDALRLLVSEGFNVVDVSFFREDARELDRVAVKNGVRVVVDAGVAPGLSNFLVGYTASRGGGLSKAEIFVGGISRRPDPPLGLSPTWSVEDLVDEYVRPARLIRRGSTVELDPLGSLYGLLEVKGVGVLEYFPTDGLRTLLYSYRDASLLVEYTLRWPGHLEFMRNLRRIGMLSSRMVNVQGCPVQPKRCLAKVIEYGLRRSEDIVVLRAYVAPRLGEERIYTSVTYSDSRWSAMSIATSTFMVAAALAMVEGLVPVGVNPPERLGESVEASELITGFLRSEGLVVEGL